MKFQHLLGDNGTMKLDPEIETLVHALNATGVLSTISSCEGHFFMNGNVFCHQNQKAQVSFNIDDLVGATRLCNQILNEVTFEGLEVSIRQYAVGGEDENEIQWSLEYRPVDLWRIKPQNGGVYISMNPKWNEKKVRELLRKAFDATIKICEEKKYLEMENPIRRTPSDGANESVLGICFPFSRKR